MPHETETRARSGAPSSSMGGHGPRRPEWAPDPRLAWRLFRRALGVWIGVRLAIAAAESLPNGRLPELPPSEAGVPEVIAVAVVVGLLGIVDSVHRNERLLLANLGLRMHAVAGVSALAAVAAEIIVTVVR